MEDGNKDKDCNKTNDINDKDYDTLVLSGGSINGIIMYGAVQYLLDKNMLKNIKTYIGTSMGSITCYLLSIGCTPTEIVSYICTNQIFELMSNISILKFIKGNGAMSFQPVHDLLEKMTLDKIGKLITLKELYEMFGNTLVCVSYNLTQDKTEYLSHLTHPDLDCLSAVRMSSNLPFIFSEFIYKDNAYTDGAICNNFPIEKAKEFGNKSIGFYIIYDTTTLPYSIKQPVNFMYKLLYIQYAEILKNKFEKIDENALVIPITPSDKIFCDFNLTDKDKLEMFSFGYTQTKEFLENK
jgi:predicted acylesterase/phospholipase RssA